MRSKKSNKTMGHLPHAGEVIDERYRLGHPVASGGMGVIVEAEQIRTGRTVVVKLLHPHIAHQDNFAERFAREVKVATLFDHSNIVRVYDVGETEDGALYLVMEYLDGEDLKAVIAREAPMPAGEVVELGLQIVDGLSEAHARQIVHRDIKPANIFVTETRRGAREVKLLDFGLAKLASTGTSDLTATGVYAGTPAYIAPETLVSSMGSDDPAVDVYAAGLVLLEMLTGEKVFDGESIPQTLIQHLKKPVRLPARLARTPLGDVLRVATEKHPGKRYADADQFYEALERAGTQTDPSLQLTPDEIPRDPRHTSPSLLNRVAGAGPQEGLDVLQNAPRHEVFVPDEDRPRAARGVTAKVDLQNDRASTTSLADDEVGSTMLLDDEVGSTVGALPSSDELRPSQPAASTPSQPVSEKLRSVVDDTSKRTVTIVAAAFVVLSATVVAALVLPGNGEAPAPSAQNSAPTSQAGDAPLEASSGSEDFPSRPEGAEIEPGDAPGAEGDDSAPRVTAHIDTEPSGAAVFTDDKKMGYTSLDAEFDAGSIPDVLTIEKEGYETEFWELGTEFETRDQGEPMTLNFRMRLHEKTPEPEERQPSPPPATSSPPPSPETTPSPPASTSEDDADDEDDVDNMLRRYLD